MLSRLLFGAFLLTAAASASTPAVGEQAPEFELKSLGGASVSLSSERSQGPVVLIVLRGFPGYQCPVCSRQVREFVTAAETFKGAGARVVMIYPGPGDKLADRAAQSEAGKTLPNGFTLLLDPDYQFTNLYGLRWDAPKETAYPSTFVLDKSGKIVFAKISKTHGGRAGVDEVVAVLRNLRE